MAGEEKRVGHIGCFVCGNRCEVRQSKARGNRFYLHCGNCGGAIHMEKALPQTKIWKEAEFLPEAAVVRPSNVTDDEPAKEGETLPAVAKPAVAKQAEPDPVQAEPEPESEPEAVEDFNPDAEPDEPEATPEPPASKKGWIAAAVIGLAAVGGAFLS